MTTYQATAYYNIAENEVLTENGKLGFMENASLIDDNLVDRFGEEKAGEILELVFENEIG